MRFCDFFPGNRLLQFKVPFAISSVVMPKQKGELIGLRIGAELMIVSFKDQLNLNVNLYHDMHKLMTLL